jgi:phenylalanyl-tRNA synthetase beta chain
VRVNVEWLRDWVDISIPATELAEKLTIAGLEVDSLETAAGDIAGVVVATITDVEPHPNADKLVVCQVDAGGEIHEVVCGAPNAARGLKTPFAAIGAELPGNLKIRRAKLRGVVSNGMLCSEKDLGLADSSSGLMELPADAPSGTSITDYLRLDDTILDIDLTPNRGDCFSIIGVAREIAAGQGVEFPPPGITAIAPDSAETFPIKLEAAAGCPRFVARIIRGVSTTASSPLWLTERLRRAGLRAIHPVVDVTNYVMLELGQPLHSYDLDKLNNGIVVRHAAAFEPLTLLDGRSIEVDPSVMVIADSSGAIGLAGIMGGQTTAVNENTSNVLLEAAFFSPEAMAGRARRFGLHTDASLRFERGVDPTQQRRAVERTTELLLKIAGGSAGPLAETALDEFCQPIEQILLRHRRIESVLGLSVSADRIEGSLGLLGMEVARKNGDWLITPPAFRFDLKIEEDLIEEVARMIGYESIPVVAESSAGHLGTAIETQLSEDRLSDSLVARGYSEIISYSFVDEALELAINPGTELIKLANPISRELSVLRRSLWPGLLKTASQNLSRQQQRMRLFEIGGQFSIESGDIEETPVLAGLVAGSRWPEHWDLETTATDFYDVKADVEALFQLAGTHSQLTFHAAEHPALMPGQTARVVLNEKSIGWIGTLHPLLIKQLELRTEVILFSLRLGDTLMTTIPKHQAYSKFPSVRRDLALVVDENIAVEEILTTVRQCAGAILQNVIIFDVYRGKGIDSSLKSVALGLILQDTSRTLTDTDADVMVATVTEHLGRVLGATIRT